jgi:hypothetical protein
MPTGEPHVHRSPYEMGKDAYGKGIKASGQDQAFLDVYVAGKQVGEAVTDLQEWNRGWEEEHNRITDAELARASEADSTKPADWKVPTKSKGFKDKDGKFLIRHDAVVDGKKLSIAAANPVDAREKADRIGLAKDKNLAPAITTSRVKASSQITANKGVSVADESGKVLATWDETKGGDVTDPAGKVSHYGHKNKWIAKVRKEYDLVSEAKIVKVHDDGDLTIKQGGATFVKTTGDKLFKEVGSDKISDSTPALSRSEKISNQRSRISSGSPRISQRTPRLA